MSVETGRRFVGAAEMEVEQLPWGPHEWLSRPGLTQADQLLLVRVRMPPGTGHSFHRHPAIEEIIYVVSGSAEQWVERERRILGPGDTAHIPTGLVLGTWNAGSEPLVVDAGILGDPVGLAPDIPASEVARAGGSTLELLREGKDRGAAVQVMLNGLCALVSCRIAAVARAVPPPPTPSWSRRPHRRSTRRQSGPPCPLSMPRAGFRA